MREVGPLGLLQKRGKHNLRLAIYAYEWVPIAVLIPKMQQVNNYQYVGNSNASVEE